MSDNRLSYESPPGIKTENVIFRLTPKERELLFEQAKKYTISISALLRFLIMELTEREIIFGDNHDK